MLIQLNAHRDLYEASRFSSVLRQPGPTPAFSEWYPENDGTGRQLVRKIRGYAMSPGTGKTENRDDGKIRGIRCSRTCRRKLLLFAPRFASTPESASFRDCNRRRVPSPSSRGLAAVLRRAPEFRRSELHRIVTRCSGTRHMHRRRRESVPFSSLIPAVWP